MVSLSDHIFNFLSQFWNNILPFYVFNVYEFGVVLRFGKWRKNVSAGFHWKIPFVDEVLHCRNSMTTMPTKNQSLTTKDGEQISIESIVKYKIEDAKKFLLEVEDAISAIDDITQGKIKELVNTKTWTEIRDLKDVEIKKLVTTEAEKFGIKIFYVTITSLVKTRVYKIINNSNQT